MLIAGDVYRPVAVDHLVILGEQVLNSDCKEIALIPIRGVMD